MRRQRQEGYFVSDTRLVSDFELALSGTPLTLLNSSAVRPFSCRFEFVNATIVTEGGVIDEATLHLRLDRTVGRGVHDDYDLANYGPKAVQLNLDVRIEGDYADLFDVKRGRLIRRGQTEASWDPYTGRLVTVHTNQGFRRGLCLQTERWGSAPHFANGTISFRIRIEPFGRWHTCLLWMPILDDRDPARPLHGCHALLGAGSETTRQRREWNLRVTSIRTPDPQINAIVARAVHDLAAMRIHRHDADASAGEGDDIESWVPGAGIPWFPTLFGRDSLVVALQTQVLSPRLAVSALQALAVLQGGNYDDSRDLQPGKIEHELRHGELAYLGLIPQTPYYGTHDATSLFVWAAGELWRWTAG
jgi:glycogen debranching enzyme